MENVAGIYFFFSLERGMDSKGHFIFHVGNIKEGDLSASIKRGRIWKGGTGGGGEAAEKSRENLRRGKNEGKRVKDGEKESHGWSAMEKYERVLGVCILDWGRPLSDKERCGCSQWWFITCIRGRSGKWMDQPLDRSQYFQWASLPFPLSFIFIWKHVQMWRKQQISAAWLLAYSFQLITDEDGGLVVPNYQEAGYYSTLVAWPTFREQKFLMFNSSCCFFFFFLQCQHVGPEMYIYTLLPILSSSCPLHKGEKDPVRNTGFILYKLQERCRGISVLIALSMHLILERSQQG